MAQATGLGRECLAEEIEQAIAEEHPEMKRGDVFELVQEWLRTDLGLRTKGRTASAPR